MSTVSDLRLDAGLPANIDAEKTILGAVLLDNAAYLEAAERLTADDFSLDSHRRIYLRMSELMSQNSAVDIVTLANMLASYKEVESIGGVAYLASLTEGLPRRPVISEYILIVKDKALLRKMMLVCSNTIARSADQSETALSIASSHTGQMEEVISGSVHQGLEAVCDMTIEVLDRWNKRAELQESPGLSFGIPVMDEATGGMQNGEQIVIGSISGVGKTTLLAQIVAANCAKGHPAAMFLVEPSRHDFLPRLWSIVGDVRYSAVTRPWTATKEERERVTWAAMQVAEWPLYIYDKSTLTIDEVIPHGRLAMHRHGVEIIGVDYLQRLAMRSAGKDMQKIRLETAKASIDMADLVKETKCRSVLLSQLNRASDMNAIPTMSRLRETGQIENDAHTIALMHLEYDAEQGHFLKTGAVIIPKQRFGIPCNLKLVKDERLATWISELQHYQESPHWSERGE